ncbi:MAG TPA: lysylphosphatidylglycerol synthase domain-containing protein [Gemmatimonadaceae bacterium]
MSVLGPRPGLTKRRAAAITARAVVLGVSVVALRHELAGLDRAQLTAALRQYDAPQVALAVLCTAASFATLGLVEFLAPHYAGRGASRAIPGRAALATAFVAHAFSQSMGFGLLTGTAVRLRAYAKYDVDAETCARISIFVTTTTLLGLFALGSIALLTAPGFSRLVWTRAAAASIGAAMAAVVVAYLAWCSLGGNKGIGVGEWRLTPPSSSMAATQMALAIADWLVTGTVLYLLLLHGTFASFTGFLAAYLVAHAAGIASHVPAGAGVFEATFLASIAPGAVNPERAGLVASLVAYRVLYYALPLCAAAALATISELRRRHGAMP